MGLTVIVLAAGQGTRMRSDLPKVLQPLAGRPLLAHVLDKAQALSPDEVRVVYGHGGERVQEAFESANVSWHLQAQQLGTGHAVQQAVAGIPADHLVMILCGDVPQITQASLAALRDAAGDGMALLTSILPDPTGYGRVIRNSAGQVERIVEHKDASDVELKVAEINTGMMVMPAGHLTRWLGQLSNDNVQGEYYLTDIIAMAVADGVTVGAASTDTPAEGRGVNDRRDLARAERAIQLQLAEGLMIDGVTLADPARIDVRGRVSAGRDVFIDVNAVLEGDVVLGDRVRIGPNVVLRNASIGDDTEVHAHCHVEKSTVGARCSVGPFARLRPDADLADGAKIGNFVEIKKSHIGLGSKVSHLTYIGDADIGKDVNIGCGTVTCNYDGVNKYRTVIGDGVFVGSGVELVAPVTIEPGAVIGAGSTITKTAPQDQLTVARARQVSLKWKKPTKIQ